MTAIRAEGLTKRFGRVEALVGLDLSVEPGTVFGFVGPNGAGKTTTIRILTGLARPSAGRAWVAGLEVKAGSGDLARCIGYLPEEPGFYPWMTPQELLDHVGRIFRLPAAERCRRTSELLKLVGLVDVGRRRIGGFSRGMRQRLGVAQALVNRPEVLILDEPASALDPAGRREVLSLIADLRGQCTVLMSTHILADVERVCDTVGIIDHGRVLIEARKEDLLSRYAAPAFELEAEPSMVPLMQAWASALGSVGWVSGVSVEGNRARVAVKDASVARRELLPSALQAGLVLHRYEMVRPSLEDVFLRLVGGGGQGQ